MDKTTLLIHRDEIKKTVKKLAKLIRKDYRDKNPLLVSVLKGSSIFAADLIRELDIPLELEFIRLSSYGTDKESCGRVKIVQGIRTSIKNRDVLVIEDIVDTGLSLSRLLKYLSGKKPATLKLCALLDKPSHRKVPVQIDYRGLTVPDKFIVGYGLDWNEKYRYLPDIYFID